MWKKCYLHQQCEAELVHPLHTFSLAAQVTKWRTFPLKFQRRNKKKLSVRQSDLLENERLVSESSDCICVSEDRLGLFQGLSRVFHFFFYHCSSLQMSWGSFLPWQRQSELYTVLFCSHSFICTDVFQRIVRLLVRATLKSLIRLNILKISHSSAIELWTVQILTPRPTSCTSKLMGERFHQMFSAADQLGNILLNTLEEKKKKKTFTLHILCIIENQYFMPPCPCAAVWWPIWRKTSSLRQIGVPPNAILLPLNRLL